MMRLVALAIAILLIALGLTGWRLSVMTHQRDEAQRRVSTLTADVSSRDKALAQLDADIQATRKREAALRLLQNQASVQALHHETIIRRETDANPALRAWSAAALPADVIRLHSRPVFSNARDYLDWLSTRDKLPYSGKQPADAG